MANTFNSEGNKEILPIFFDVEPHDVKLKTPLYRDAILDLEREKKLSNEQVDAWRGALMEVDAIKGWEAKKYKGHGELIKLVVEKVVERLKSKNRLVTEHLVGIDDRVVAIRELLDVNYGGVRLIQIHGMGGIGKTTLAKVVFNQLSSHFGKWCCFLEDVRAKSSRTDGLVELQKKLLSEIGIHAGTKDIDEINYGVKRIREALCNRKVLIVLDDVDNSEQVENLVGKGILYSGSRILITTRNKDVLRINRLKYPILDYEMEVMSTNHALELFSRHAFNRDSPTDDYNDLSGKIVFATGRLPLALEVIGSFLYHKTYELWKETLDKLRKAPHEDVFGKLKISYDALTFEQQQIFLDIACFFVGRDKTNAIYMWEDCKFYPNNGIDVLINMSLIRIMENNKFWMHDQIIDLGREIVHRENPTNPGERSRIWIDKEILDAIRTKEMKRNVQALTLDLRRRYPKDLESEEMGRFEHLRYLKLNEGTFIGNLTNRFMELRWISWSDAPSTAKPTNMNFRNGVILEFSDIDLIDDSKLQSLIKMATKLKVLSLTRCHSIIRLPDFSGCPNIVRLTFKECSNLRKINTSIRKLKCLTDLKICDCSCLEDLPNEIGALVNLKCFYVQQCKVKKLPDSIWKLKSLREVRFESSCFEELDSANAWELPSAIGVLQKLEVLIISSCHLKGQLPPEIGSLPFLRILDLSLTNISEVPKTLSMLPHLQRLMLTYCGEIQELPLLPTSLTHLKVLSPSLQGVPDLSNLTNLVELDLSVGAGRDKLYTGELWWIGRLSKLTKLSLRLPNARAPDELATLPLLNQLGLFGLDMQAFPQLPLSLQKLCLDDFNSIVSLSPNLRNLSCLGLANSPKQEFQLDGLQLPNLTELEVEFCQPLKRFKLSNMRKLNAVKIFLCQKLVEIQFSGFKSLEILSIQHCESFQRLVHVGEAGQDDSESTNELISCEGRLILPLRFLNKLQSFMLVGCTKILDIQFVGTSESWASLFLSDCPYLRSLGGLSNLTNLRCLSIYDNRRLRVIEGLDELNFLDYLTVRGCGSIERLIDVSNTKLPIHCLINISGSGKDFRGPLEYYKHHKESCFDWIWYMFRRLVRSFEDNFCHS